MPSSVHNGHDHSHHGHHGDQHHQPAASPPEAATAHVGGQPEYTCPMHPQVRQRGPGNCPICGMALEPVLATAEAGESPELRDMGRRF
jgi:Cu+-exporting ATPase